MDESKELVLGFDRRVEDHAGAKNWNAKRREAFLLRTDVLQPYSADTTVWPSVFDSDLRTGTCIGHQDLWGDLPCLLSFSSSEFQAGSECKLIAITLILEKFRTEYEWWQSNIPPTTPSERDKAWKFLGYDVADRWLLSGLSNCGFLPDVDDASDLRTQWNSKLNDHHLFNAMEDARAFQSLSNSRASEHSPFFIFSIWSVQA